MIIKEFGNIKLEKEVISQDRKKCVHVENHGIGEEAIYLGNYFFARCKVIPLKCISRVFKRVAMSKGGFTGKGIFGSIPYVVVLLNDGSEVQASFKDELLVDKFLDYINENYPGIKTLSARQEEALEKARQEKEARKVKNLSDIAKESLKILRESKEKLLKDKDIYRKYSIAAKEKRNTMISKDVYVVFLWIMLIFGVATAAYGIYAVINKQGFAMYFLLFGFAVIFFFVSMGVLPTQRFNKKAIQEKYEEAMRNAIITTEHHLGTDFPIPSKYVHFATLSRLITYIEEGRGETIKEAYLRYVEDLKKIDKSVTLSADDYEEIMAVKPIYLIENYQ